MPVPWSDGETSIAARFESVVSANPQALAFVSRTASLTYGQLNHQANRIAHAVGRVAAGTVGALATLLDDDETQVTTLLAAGKLGRVYVPIDAACPLRRGAFILNNVDADVVVTNSRLAPIARAMAGPARTVLDLDGLDESENCSDPNGEIASTAALWVMYTSGTTGEPKGVIQTHRNLLHYVRTYAGGFDLSPRARVLTLMNHTTSGGGHDALMALLTGAVLQSWNPRRDGVGGLAAWIDEQRSTLVSAAPSVFRQLLASLPGSSRLESVKFVKLWSEPSFRRDFDAFCRHFNDDAVLVNRLGSTEQGTTLWCFARKDFVFDGPHLPVGYPGEDASVLLLGEDGNEVADGQIGEIVARSRYLSPGYVNREKETTAAFSVDPIDPHLRRYRTGDLGYRRADGCMVCVGRKDGQVKIRGYRVETAEVEQVLLTHSAIREAIVTGYVDAPDADPRLVAYLIAATDIRPAVADLRRSVSDRLPDYMVPAAFVWMNAFPRSANGKVLRRAFPAPGRDRPELDTRYRAPGNETESVVAMIWSEVLQLTDVGADDQFMDLGGDSLRAIQIIGRVRDRFNVELSPHDALHAATIVEMSRIIDSARSLAPLRAS